MARIAHPTRTSLLAATPAALVALAAVSLTGCSVVRDDSGAHSTVSRTEVESATRLHGDGDATRSALNILRSGKFADAATVEAPSRDMTPVGAYSILVPIDITQPVNRAATDPADRGNMKLAGWAREFRSNDGVKLVIFYDPNWSQLAIMNDAGVITGPGGSKPYGDAAFNIGDAASRLYGDPGYIGTDGLKYETVTVGELRAAPLKVGKEGYTHYDLPEGKKRGVAVVVQPAGLSLRPLNPGDLEVKARALDEAAFNATEQRRYEALRAARAASEKPAEKK